MPRSAALVFLLLVLTLGTPARADEWCTVGAWNIENLGDRSAGQHPKALAEHLQLVRVDVLALSEIHDEDGNPLPTGTAGEIVKRSPTVMQGYYKNAEATAKALKGGWLYTGDLGYVDADGYLYFVDRVKDMVRRGDENISSEEVERVLNSHPQVAESAVIAVPDQIRGEEVKAYIVLKSDATPESVPPEAIWNFCKPHLAAFKVPRFIEYRDELPKTPSSKVQKNILRDESKQGCGRVFDRFAK